MKEFLYFVPWMLLCFITNDLRFLSWQYVMQVFTSCDDVQQKKQFCYMVARHVSPEISKLVGTILIFFFFLLKFSPWVITFLIVFLDFSRQFWFRCCISYCSWSFVFYTPLIITWICSLSQRVEGHHVSFS